MLVLANPTDSIELKLSGAVATTELPWTAHWVDVLTTDQSVSAIGKTDGTSSGATVVTMVPGPGLGHTRTVKSLSVFNADSTGATVTVRLNNATTTRIFVQPLLSTGDTLEYTE